MARRDWREDLASQGMPRKISVAFLFFLAYFVIDLCVVVSFLFYQGKQREISHDGR